MKAKWGEGLGQKLHDLVAVDKVSTYICVRPQSNLFLFDRLVQWLGKGLGVGSVHLFCDSPLGLEIRKGARPFHNGPLCSRERGRNKAKTSRIAVKSS